MTNQHTMKHKPTCKREHKINQLYKEIEPFALGVLRQIKTGQALNEEVAF